jgi:peptide/nickel transport system substrate-binding protein
MNLYNKQSRRLYLFVLLMLLVGLSGLSVLAQDDLNILTIGREGNTTYTRNFNPFSPNALNGTTTAIYERLIIWNPINGDIVPWLATGYEWSDDGLTLTFDVREGVMWSDGEPFSAADVAFTFALQREMFGEGVYPYLTSVESPDATTAVFQLSEPFSPAIYEVGQQVIVPEHIWTDVEDPANWTNEEPVGTGPFTEVAVFQDQVYELHRNPTYWQEGKPYIDGLRWPAFPTNDQVTLATINGEVDWADIFIPQIQTTYIDRDPEHYNYWFPATTFTAQLLMNNEVAPFDDPVVRRAVSLAIDRNQVVSIAMQGYTTPIDGTGLSDAFSIWKDEDFVAANDWTTRNVELANQLLDDAGYAMGSDGIRVMEDGMPMSFEIIVGSASTDWVSSSQVIAQNLRDIGMDVRVNGQDWGLVIERKQRGDFQMAHSWSGFGPTPYNYYRSVLSCDHTMPIGEITNENYHRGCSEEATDLLNQFTATSDPTEQMNIMRQIELIYVDIAPVAPLFGSPEWGEFSTLRYTDFPSADNPYATLASRANTAVMVMTTVRPVDSQ